MAGRRTKYTPETVKKLTDALALGAAYKHACDYAGITFETFSQWREHKPGFSDQIKSAEGQAVVGWLAKIEHAATDGNWTAAAWKLERRYPADYGRTLTEQRHTGPDGGAVLVEQRHTINLERLTDDDLRTLDTLVGRAADT